MKKFLFFDVDGTLYNSKKQLPQSAKEAIFKARENGHEIAIATGRAPFMIAGILEELQIDTYVTFNGQYVVYKGEVIYTNQIANETLMEILQFGEQHDHPFVFLNEKEMIASKSGYSEIEESLATLHYPYPTIDENYYLHTPVYQTLVFAKEHEQVLYEQQFQDIQFVRWHPYSCDMLPSGGSKALGITKLIEHINFEMEDVIAFGDGLNDVEMLRDVGLGVAMENGHDEAKKVAAIVADHVDQDGLYKIMKELKLF
ncbi:Cof-type HAD-IIB family hydrolase [Solibacillus sp. MA9]|uniref:Cof-type HAD-IIB family hydrolase n=1 Tax=Solibacillus palustris TaxID=2908203 RepID=A0ABS9U8W6_9BACL|nr:Cof-type HAD-IIB family hydrolase [Solibacillus sp. MA9]MCH7320779.1 Cof-type HAD-IIB family hydrolase [Solibacillus sp. MA9]